MGKDAELEITQIGKECHNKCAIFFKVGDCVMPREGIFARVNKTGEIFVGDEFSVILSDNFCVNVNIFTHRND